MADTESREERVDGADLDSSPPTPVPKSRRVDVIPAVRVQEGKGVEAFQDRFPRPGPCEPLQDLLKDQSGGDHQLTGPEGIFEGSNLRQIGGGVPAQGHGPHARVHQQAHDRERSAL